MNGVPILSAGQTKPLALKLDEVIKSYIEGILMMHNYRLGKASKALGISRTTLYRKMKKYGIVKRKRHEQQ